MLCKHSEKQLYNEGQGPNPALGSARQFCKELSSRLQLPGTLQDPTLVTVLCAAAEGWRWKKGCRMLFPKLGNVLLNLVSQSTATICGHESKPLGW